MAIKKDNYNYALCYIGESLDNKMEVYPIYNPNHKHGCKGSTLKFIDIYTSYFMCHDEKNLYMLLPKDVKNFLEKYLKYNKTYNKKGYGFVIKRSSGKNFKSARTTLDVLYSDNSDIPFLNKNDVYEILKSLQIKNTYNEQENLIKKEFFNKFYGLLSDNKVSFANFDQAVSDYSKNHKVINSRVEAIRTESYFIRILLEEITSNYYLKRQIALLSKQYLKKLNCCKTSFKSHDEVLDGRIKSGFNILNANGSDFKILPGSINEMFKEELSDYKKKYPSYSKDIDLLYKTQNLNVIEEKLSKEQKEILCLEKENQNLEEKNKELKERIKELEKTTLVSLNTDYQIELLEKEISENVLEIINNEAKIIFIEKGNVFYSDAGLEIYDPEVDNNNDYKK